MNTLEKLQRVTRGGPPPQREILELQQQLAKRLGLDPLSQSDTPRGVLLVIEHAPGSPTTEQRIWNLSEMLHAPLIVPLVLVEGAEGRLYTELYSFFPNSKAKRSTSTIMMTAGHLSGPEAFCIASESPPPLYGIDSTDLWKKNSETAQCVSQHRSTLQAVLQAAGSAGQLPAGVVGALKELRPCCALELPHASWVRLKSHYPNSDQALASVAPLWKLLRREELESSFAELVQAAFDFYEVASQRSDFMTQRSQQYMRDENALWGIAVVTGFHGPVLLHNFAQEGWTVFRQQVLPKLW